MELSQNLHQVYNPSVPLPFNTDSFPLSFPQLYLLTYKYLSGLPFWPPPPRRKALYWFSTEQCVVQGWIPWTFLFSSWLRLQPSGLLGFLRLGYPPIRTSRSHTSMCPTVPTLAVSPIIFLFLTGTLSQRPVSHFAMTTASSISSSLHLGRRPSTVCQYCPWSKK